MKQIHLKLQKIVANVSDTYILIYISSATLYTRRFRETIDLFAVYATHARGQTKLYRTCKHINISFDKLALIQTCARLLRMCVYFIFLYRIKKNVVYDFTLHRAERERDVMHVIHRTINK